MKAIINVTEVGEDEFRFNSKNYGTGTIFLSKDEIEIIEDKKDDRDCKKCNNSDNGKPITDVCSSCNSDSSNFEPKITNCGEELLSQAEYINKGNKMNDIKLTEENANELLRHTSFTISNDDVKTTIKNWKTKGFIIKNEIEKAIEEFNSFYENKEHPDKYDFAELYNKAYKVIELL